MSRTSTKSILAKIKSGKIRAVTNPEVLQEILHRYFSIGKPDIAEIGYASMIRLCLTILPVRLAETHRALELMKTNPAITSRDAIHAATMINNDIKGIISADSQFDLIPGIKRIDPARWRWSEFSSPPFLEKGVISEIGRAIRNVCPIFLGQIPVAIILISPRKKG